MKEKYIDLIGVYAALLCMIHCLFAPVLLTLPLGLSHDPIIDCSFLVLGAFPVFKVLGGKAQVYIKLLLLTSYLIVAIAIGLEIFFRIENFQIYIGASGLILGHILNYKKQLH